MSVVFLTESIVWNSEEIQEYRSVDSRVNFYKTTDILYIGKKKVDKRTAIWYVVHEIIECFRNTNP